MESIDRLREYVCDMTSVSSMTKANVSVYLDAIEQEVEQLRDREYQNGREDARDAVEFADRLCRASERREDVTLWGVDYMPLPVDADGVPIHVGDVMEVGNGRRDKVRFLALNGDGWSFNDKGWVPKWSHHHKPTVEDVLREFADRVCNSGHQWGLDAADTIAEYAAKLRLAGDE